MDPTSISLFSLADRRLAWVGARERLLAENVANADTPGWRARDLRPFADILAGQVISPTPVEATPGALPTAPPTPFASVETGADAGPDGNNVELDTALSKVAASETAQALALGLYGKYLAMFRTALGR